MTPHSHMQPHHHIRSRHHMSTHKGGKAKRAVFKTPSTTAHRKKKAKIWKAKLKMAKTLHKAVKRKVNKLAKAAGAAMKRMLNARSAKSKKADKSLFKSLVKREKDAKANAKKVGVVMGKANEKAVKARRKWKHTKRTVKRKKTTPSTTAHRKKKAKIWKAKL